MYKVYRVKNSAGAMNAAKNQVFIELLQENCYLVGGWEGALIFGSKRINILVGIGGLPHLPSMENPGLYVLPNLCFLASIQKSFAFDS